MDSRQQGESLTEEVICPICLDFFTDPVTLECGHNFCRSCISQSWEKQEINCGQEFPDKSLRDNQASANLAEKAQTLNVNPQEKESKHHCEEHQEELKLFCETDKKLICVICRDSREHKSHNFIPIKEAVGIDKDWVKSSLESLTGKKAAALEMEWQQKQKISKIREESSSLQTHIKSEFTKMHQMLTEKEQSLLRDLREQEENILKPMERNLCKIQDNLNSLQEKLSTLEKQLEQKDRVVFLKEEASWERRIHDNSNELSLTDGALSTEKFNIVLPFPVWNEMLETIKPVSVTLDVETASPQLVVSEDLKSLRLIRNRRSLPDNEKRFSNPNSLCALGSEGFTSGRHYWEVEVGGNQGWSLGVASESVERKRWVSLIPKNGFWTMGRDEDQFYTNTSPPLPLCVGQIPRKVGVYLSYEYGTVSFYNADTKSHLHTFTGNKFTGKLYPFFEVWGLNKFLRISC
ncbi:zinc-binding protein A33-like [Hemiscyllium ocellatum]|uniref:zinc-binding protein A33-like n=1 Tax=Hemiscyllium ocellatum TaxID=170820 RepID=UPI0029670615|nr:zinc-binding protein A33-like [Hemiscyllium ocellatum]